MISAEYIFMKINSPLYVNPQFSHSFTAHSFEKWKYDQTCHVKNEGIAEFDL